MSTPLHTQFAGSIPEHYDRCLGPAWFGPAARGLAAMLARDPGGDVLELACGTGLVTRALRERLDPSRTLIATDLSPAMLDYARAHVGSDGIQWREADATKIPFADARFAAVVCALGVMFVPDKEAFFRESRRVLKADGTLLLSVWDRIEDNPCAQIYVDTIESLFPGDEEMRFRLPWSMHDEAAMRRYLAGAGFEPVRIEKRRMPVGDVTPRQMATGQVRGTPRGLLLEKKGLSMDEAIDRLTAAIERYLASGKPLYGSAIFVEARAVTRP